MYSVARGGRKGKGRFVLYKMAVQALEVYTAVFEKNVEIWII